MTVYTPVTRNRWTPLDDLGALLGLRREPGEELRDFKDKIMDIFVHPGGVTHEGIVNDLAREFSVDRTAVFEVTYSGSSNWAFHKSSSVVYLYHHYNNPDDYVLAEEIRLFNTDMTTVADVVTQINAVDNFTATVLDSSTQDESGYYLLDCHNHKINTANYPSGTTIKLDHKPIVSGSLAIGTDAAFSQEVEVSDMSNNIPGEYAVDYINGVLYTNQFPVDVVQCAYRYIESPFRVYHVPVSVSAFTNPDLMKRMFIQKVNKIYSGVLNEYSNYIPKPELVECIHELKRVTDIYWGA